MSVESAAVAWFERTERARKRRIAAAVVAAVLAVVAAIVVPTLLTAAKANAGLPTPATVPVVIDDVVAEAAADPTEGDQPHPCLAVWRADLDHVEAAIAVVESVIEHGAHDPDMLAHYNTTEPLVGGHLDCYSTSGYPIVTGDLISVDMFVGSATDRYGIGASPDYVRGRATEHLPRLTDIAADIAATIHPR